MKIIISLNPEKQEDKINVDSDSLTAYFGEKIAKIFKEFNEENKIKFNTGIYNTILVNLLHHGYAIENKNGIIFKPFKRTAIQTDKGHLIKTDHDSVKIDKLVFIYNPFLYENDIETSIKNFKTNKVNINGAVSTVKLTDNIDKLKYIYNKLYSIRNELLRSAIQKLLSSQEFYIENGKILSAFKVDPMKIINSDIILDEINKGIKPFRFSKLDIYKEDIEDLYIIAIEEGIDSSDFKFKIDLLKKQMVEIEDNKEDYFLRYSEESKEALLNSKSLFLFNKNFKDLNEKQVNIVETKKITNAYSKLLNEFLSNPNDDSLKNLKSKFKIILKNENDYNGCKHLEDTLQQLSKHSEYEDLLISKIRKDIVKKYGHDENDSYNEDDTSTIICKICGEILEEQQLIPGIVFSKRGFVEPDKLVNDIRKRVISLISTTLVHNIKISNTIYEISEIVTSSGNLRQIINKLRKNKNDSPEIIKFKEDLVLDSYSHAISCYICESIQAPLLKKKFTGNTDISEYNKMMKEIKVGGLVSNIKVSNLKVSNLKKGGESKRLKIKEIKNVSINYELYFLNLLEFRIKNGPFPFTTKNIFNIFHAAIEDIRKIFSVRIEKEKDEIYEFPSLSIFLDPNLKRDEAIKKMFGSYSKAFLNPENGQIYTPFLSIAKEVVFNKENMNTIDKILFYTYISKNNSISPFVIKSLQDQKDYLIAPMEGTVEKENIRDMNNPYCPDGKLHELGYFILDSKTYSKKDALELLSKNKILNSSEAISPRCKHCDNEITNGLPIDFIKMTKIIKAKNFVNEIEIICPAITTISKDVNYYHEFENGKCSNCGFSKDMDILEYYNKYYKDNKITKNYSESGIVLEEKSEKSDVPQITNSLEKLLQKIRFNKIRLENIGNGNEVLLSDADKFIIKRTYPEVVSKNIESYIDLIIFIINSIENAVPISKSSSILKKYEKYQGITNMSSSFPDKSIYFKIKGIVSDDDYCNIIYDYLFILLLNINNANSDLAKDILNDIISSDNLTFKQPVSSLTSIEEIDTTDFGISNPADSSDFYDDDDIATRPDDDW